MLSMWYEMKIYLIKDLIKSKRCQFSSVSLDDVGICIQSARDQVDIFFLSTVLEANESIFKDH